MKRAIVFVAFVLAAIVGPASYAAAQQQRLALVIGQGAYERGQLPTAANDAGLMAQTLTSAGFEVIQGRDLGASDLRRVIRDFLDKAQDLEPDAAIMVYLSGHGVQLEGENYLLPVDVRIQRDVDVPIEGFRLSDLVRSLERSPAQVRMIVADMAREYSLSSTGEPIAGGLALVEPPAGFLIAFSSAPNITAADGPGPYGAYASALVEMIREPGLPLNEVFSRIRLRTHETTNGLQTPWHTANLNDAPFVFFEPTEVSSTPLVREVRRIEDVPAEEAYTIAVERDTIQDYQAFLRRYPDHRLSRRVSAVLSARREAIVWRKTVSRNTSEAYWTYLRRYPNGPHAADCRRRLARLSAPFAPPPVFEEVIYEDLPPPLPIVETIEVVEVVTIIREAPPPPPPPIYLLPERDYEDEVFVTIIREPPPPPIMAGVLPIPVAIPVPYRARPPRVFYQPIAPVTPRGAVAIPVATPPVFGSLLGDGPQGRRPPRAPRPQQPMVVPRQPGLAAPIQPIPASVNPRASSEGGAARPGAPTFQTRPSRLPARPIPLPGTQPGQPRPGPGAGSGFGPGQPTPRDAEQAIPPFRRIQGQGGQAQPDARPGAPVPAAPGATRPWRPGMDPAAPAAEAPRPIRPTRGSAAPGSPARQDSAAPQPSFPGAVAPAPQGRPDSGIGRRPPRETRPDREADAPRPGRETRSPSALPTREQGPGAAERPRPGRSPVAEQPRTRAPSPVFSPDRPARPPRDQRPAAGPVFPRPAVQDRPAPRQERPFPAPQRAAPAPAPQQRWVPGADRQPSAGQPRPAPAPFAQPPRSAPAAQSRPAPSFAQPQRPAPPAASRPGRGAGPVFRSRGCEPGQPCPNQ